MIVDSSALAEQVVADVIASAFDSAGQRCSALRLLCLQDDIAERTLTMLKGAMRELSVGQTDRLAVDIGPVITQDARQNIERYIEEMRAAGHVVEQVELSDDTRNGTFVAPTIIEIDDIAERSEEHTSELQSLMRISYDVFCLKKKKSEKRTHNTTNINQSKKLEI